MTPEEICTHLGEEYDRQLGAVAPPIYQTSLFTRKRASSGYNYSRTANPTVELAELKIAALEGAERALCFSSGMGAISAAIMHTIESGSHVIAPRSVYLPVRGLLSDYLTRFGVTVSFVSGTDIDEITASITEHTRLIYLETPVSNVFSLQDLGAIGAIARERGITTIADNTWATPLFQQPHAFGIDLVVHSASKYLGGHSDLVAGVVTGDTETLTSMQHAERGLFGASMDPHQAWLLVRSLRTLPVRMKSHQEHAKIVADFLDHHPRVAAVHYPGLASHPQAELAARQMTGYSGLMSFVIEGDQHEIHQSLRELEHVEIGPSWGGHECLINTPGLGIDETRSRELGIPIGLIRISVGLEDPNDLVRDLDRMLKRIS